MIHNTLLKVLACCTAGASLAGLAAVCVLLEGIDAPWEQIYERYSANLGAISLLGAILGLVVGIGWAIEHKAARWRFVGWTVGGLVVGLGFSEINGWFVLAGAVLGLAAGILTALESAGKLRSGK